MKQGKQEIPQFDKQNVVLTNLEKEILPRNILDSLTKEINIESGVPAFQLAILCEIKITSFLNEETETQVGYMACSKSHTGNSPGVQWLGLHFHC